MGWLVTLGVLGKMQEQAALDFLDRQNNEPVLGDQCMWCGGAGFRKYVCSPLAEPHATAMARGEAVQSHFHTNCDCSPCLGGRHTHSELCEYCQGTGLSVELGVAG